MIQLHPGGIPALAPKGAFEPPEEAEQAPPAVVRPAKTGEESSLRGLLAQNLGCYVTATFLAPGGQTAVREGLLESVGSDCVVLYQPQSDSYVAGDLYALRLVEFHTDCPDLWGKEM